MQHVLNIQTDQRQGLYDITADVKAVLKQSPVASGIVHIYVRGATAGIMIQENWDHSVQTDVIDFLSKLIPNGVWKHDAQDGNGDAHLKSGIAGPSEIVPVMDGQLMLSTWQNIFLCEFDGPRSQREVVVSICTCNS